MKRVRRRQPKLPVAGGAGADPAAAQGHRSSPSSTLGPRLIVATHHDAIGGPYHRNDRAIADVMKAFRGRRGPGAPDRREYRSDYLLICPDMSTATIFMAEAPNGFYAPAGQGAGSGLAEPIELPKNSPFKMWKVKR